jgi:hypothetical protein
MLLAYAGAAATQADHDLKLKQLQCTLRRQNAARERHNTPTAALAAVRKALPTAHGSSIGNGPDRCHGVTARGDKLGLERKGPDARERANNVGTERE